MKKFFLFVLMITLIITQAGCGVKNWGSEHNSQDAPISKEGYFFDTVCNISIYDMKDMSEENANRVLDSVYEEAKRYENMLSKTVEGSEIWKLNNDGSGTLSREALQPLVMGLRHGEISGGKFDITMGAVTDLWDFHQEGEGKLPDDGALNEALQTVDYRTVQVAENGDASAKVTLGKEGQQIDLGGVAKGYICDQMTDFLKDKGVTSAIINLGGNITVIGEKPSGGPFKIGIEKPYSGRREIIGSVDMKDQTIVTSGIYERFIQVGDKKYHHILDPATGYPVETDVVSVTIISDRGNSMECDALSTTALLLGSKKGMELVEKTQGFEALFILDSGNVVKSSGFEYDKI